MARSVLLSDKARRFLLDLVIEEGGDADAATKVAARFNTNSPYTLGSWIVGLRGPFARERESIEKAAAKRAGGPR